MAEHRGFLAEWKRLPWLLGKLLGGMTAAGGFTAAVIFLTRWPDPGPGVVIPALLAGGAGIALFLYANRGLPLRPAVSPRHSALAWLLLLLFAGIFLLATWLTTR
ncbi:hypothetical protein JCM30471_29240 [Desulfuromonas carbonis]|uniref:hypothetical protein n=1 Tax=Desulfuromonas sp. DDH964 TaxID=1823759 RepID=UPI00078E627A|nr:hypothetical protein [Desulfuromonas sp. DDH964]AMV71103.1 hypothetical protein DBW_0718 [Desulfuromonas sp. DDH964]